MQNYLEFQTESKSEGLPKETDNILVPGMILSGTKIRAKYDERCLKQEKIPFRHKNLINLYIVYKTNLWSYNLGACFILGNSFLELLS